VDLEFADAVAVGEFKPKLVVLANRCSNESEP
jgi:hypothetical protein